MHILYLVPHVPNPTKARSWWQIRGLLDTNQRVTVVTLARSTDDWKHISRLQAMNAAVIHTPLSKVQALRNSLIALAAGQPMQARFMWSAGLMQQIEGCLQSDPPDIIHVEHLRMAIYGQRLLRRWPVVWDAVDHLASLYEQAAANSRSWLWRQVARIEAPRLRRYEIELTRQFPQTLVITSRDQALFRENSSYAERVQVAAFGLRIEPLPSVQTRAENTLIITGALDYHPNVASVLYFIDQIWPLLRQARPNLKLQLVGANPVSSIRALGGDSIEVTGFVPSLTDRLQRATISLAPVRYGSGVQIKALEAFLTATPLVASSVALRGIGAQPGEHVLVGDTPQAFAAAVLRLLDDPALRAQIGAAGRRYIEEQHDLGKTTADLIGFYGQVIGKHAVSGLQSH